MKLISVAAYMDSTGDPTVIALDEDGQLYEWVYRGMGKSSWVRQGETEFPDEEEDE
jgi:hypothetical protein